MATSDADATTPPAVSPATENAPATKSEKVARMPPTLDQLAARMSAAGNVSAPSTGQSISRPRLATQVLLRNGSQVSLSSSTAASTADSMAVQPASTRSVSPDSNASSPLSTIPPISAIGGEGDPLTSDRVEKHNAEMDKKSSPAPRGYKNIPSLDAITKRITIHRQLSIDGSSKPPEPETFEDPATPGIPQKVPENPLQCAWTMYFDSKSKPQQVPTAEGQAHPAPTETDDYEAGLNVIGEFDTVQSFCRYFNWLKPPSKLERNSNYHLFKSGIKPMWEDEANANGGKWVLTMKNNPELLDRCWTWLTMALVGEEIEEDDEICGAVVSLRSKVDRIQLWIRAKDDVEKVNSIGKKLVSTLGVSEADGIGLEFQYNSEDRPPQNKYISIHAYPQSSFRPNFGHNNVLSPTSAGEGGPPSAGPSSAFGNFMPPNSTAWRNRRG